MSVLYVSGNSVKSITADGYGAVEYSDSTIPSITDMDYNVKMRKLYVTSSMSGKLVEVNGTHNVVTVTNIGHPSRVAVDWVSGNLYFTDSEAATCCVRVCNVDKKRCARLQKLPSDAKVTAFIVDPTSRRMFYCVTRELESVIWSASLAGRHVTDLATVRNCTGLAVDPFARKLYVAETGPPHIIRMDLEGDSHKKILADHPQLQAPHGLAIFEDNIYYLVANSFRLSRCMLFGPKHCETYIYRVFDANTFVVVHESVQRDDLKNECQDFVCGNVCALEKDGPVCLCDDGEPAKDGACPLVEMSELPLFNGWSCQAYLRAHHAYYTIVAAVLILFSLYLSLVIYYHFVYKFRKNRKSNYTEVRFQRNSQDGIHHTIELGTNDPGIAHEFVNPLQFVRTMLQQSFRDNKQIVTVEVNTDASSLPQQDLSDTESDLDAKDTKRIISRK